MCSCSQFKHFPQSQVLQMSEVFQVYTIEHMPGQWFNVIWQTVFPGFSSIDGNYSSKKRVWNMSPWYWIRYIVIEIHYKQLQHIHTFYRSEGTRTAIYMFIIMYMSITTCILHQIRRLNKTIFPGLFPILVLKGLPALCMHWSEYPTLHTTASMGTFPGDFPFHIYMGWWYLALENLRGSSFECPYTVPILIL